MVNTTGINLSARLISKKVISQTHVKDEEEIFQPDIENKFEKDVG